MCVLLCACVSCCVLVCLVVCMTAHGCVRVAGFSVGHQTNHFSCNAPPLLLVQQSQGQDHLLL